MREIPAVAALQFGVFTDNQAMADGWTASAPRHAVRIDQLVRPRPATFAVPTDPNDPDRHVTAATRRAIAAALTHHDAVVSNTAAARWLGHRSSSGCPRVASRCRRAHGATPSAPTSTAHVWTRTTSSRAEPPG